MKSLIHIRFAGWDEEDHLLSSGPQSPVLAEIRLINDNSYHQKHQVIHVRPVRIYKGWHVYGVIGTQKT